MDNEHLQSNPSLKPLPDNFICICTRSFVGRG